FTAMSNGSRRSATRSSGVQGVPPHAPASGVPASGVPASGVPESTEPPSGNVLRSPSQPRNATRLNATRPRTRTRERYHAAAPRGPAAQCAAMAPRTEPGLRIRCSADVLLALLLILNADRVTTARAGRADDIKHLWQNAGLKAPPEEIYLRAFKKEQQLE